MTDLQLVNLTAAHRTRLATFDAAIRDSLIPADQRWLSVRSA